MTNTLQEIEVLIRAGNRDAAVMRLESYCSDNPGDARACFYLGNLLLQAGRWHDALQAFDRVLHLQPDNVDALLGQCTVWHALEHPDKVIDCLQRAIAIQPREAELHYNLGLAFEVNGHLEEALASCRTCLSIRPGHLPAVALQAAVYKRQQRYTQAMELIDPLLQRGILHPRLVDVFLGLCRSLARCEEAVALAQRVVMDPSTTQQDRMTLHFSAGHALDRMARYDEAFEQFRQANAIRCRVPPDVSGLQRHVRAIIDAFAVDPVRDNATSHADGSRLVFIIGMPRSGTTLVEQILASHPDVFGAGELRAMPDVANTAGQITGTGVNYPHCMRDPDSGHMGKLRQTYLCGLPEAARGARVVTDKQPGNFLNLGLVRALFPDAVIIHCERDPRDTCLSCYFQNFTGLPYTYDLSAIGKTWRLYRQLMQHWETVGVPMLTVSYEAMVDDLEAQTRRLVEYCGLTWSEDCLRYYENERAVATISHDQVRQPIYRASVGRWRHYHSHLGTLLEALQLTGVD